MSEYMKRVNSATTADELNGIIETAANDDSLTNAEYEAVYRYALMWVSVLAR